MADAQDVDNAAARGEVRCRDCPFCGYSTEGLPAQHHCPECGFYCEADARVYQEGRTVWVVSAILHGILAGVSVAILMWMRSWWPLLLSGCYLVFAYMQLARRRRFVAVSPQRLQIVRRTSAPGSYEMSTIATATWRRTDGAVKVTGWDGGTVVVIRQNVLTSHRKSKLLADDITRTAERLRGSGAMHDHAPSNSAARPSPPSE